MEFVSYKSENFVGIVTINRPKCFERFKQSSA